MTTARKEISFGKLVFEAQQVLRMFGEVGDKFRTLFCSVVTPLLQMLHNVLLRVRNSLHTSNSPHVQRAKALVS